MEVFAVPAERETLCALQAEDLGFNELASMDRLASGGAALVRQRVHTLWKPLPEPPLTRVRMRLATARLGG
jgi:hypothetical protein